MVFTTWREDGHCDHEAVGRASADGGAGGRARRCTNCRCGPGTGQPPKTALVPWQRARKILLTPDAVARKRHAIHAFASQLEGDPQIGLPPVLAPLCAGASAATFRSGVCMSVDDRYFDGLFAGNDDPWAFRQRWYEQRKRAMTLAALPRPHYRAIFEPGCANGELSAELASRCDRLLCCDTAAAAVSLARTPLGLFDHAEVRQSRLPERMAGRNNST